jgi:hypothetical protein
MDQMTVADHEEADIQKKERGDGENRQHQLKPAVVQQEAPVPPNLGFADNVVERPAATAMQIAAGLDPLSEAAFMNAAHTALTATRAQDTTLARLKADPALFFRSSNRAHFFFVAPIRPTEPSP